MILYRKYKQEKESGWFIKIINKHFNSKYNITEIMNDYYHINNKHNISLYEYICI